MKKVLIGLFVFAALATFDAAHLHAQENSRIGLKAGGGLYSLTTSVSFLGLTAEETSDSKFGLSAGVFYEKPFSEMFSGQIEALYVQKGGKDDLAESDLDPGLSAGSGDLTLSYIDIPAMLKFNLPIKSDEVSPFIYMGGFAGYLLDATAETDDGAFDQIEIKDLLKNLNYGFILGAGANFGAISVDFRYDLGLANIFDSDSDLFDELENEFGDDEEFGEFDELLDSIELNTGGFLLTVGYAF